MVASKKRNLLLCFDAFGTLFRPKGSVVQQYAHVARQCGITGFSEDQLATHLTAAIRHERAENPNYGKATGLGATRWWTNVSEKPLCRAFARCSPSESMLTATFPCFFVSDG